MPNPTDDFDDDDTEELPVLIETVALQDAGDLAFSPPDDTANQTALHSIGAETGAEALAERSEQILALEAQIRVLTESARDLEHLVAEKNQRIEELSAALASARDGAPGSTAAERQLATQLAVRDARLAELIDTVQRLQQAAAVSSAEIETLRGLVESERRETEALRSHSLAGIPASDAVSKSVQALREDHAALVNYIAGRRAWWDEMQSKNAALEARTTELEQELAAGAKRVADAEALASRESERAVELRTELADYARRFDALEREQRL